MSYRVRPEKLGEYLFELQRKHARFPCAVCGLFFPSEELVDGFCPNCFESEPAAIARVLVELDLVELVAPYLQEET